MVPPKFKKRNLKRFLMRNLLTFRNRAENRNSQPGRHTKVTQLGDQYIVVLFVECFAKIH